MKKIYSLIVLACLTMAVSGQTYLLEDFSGNVMPPAGWSIDGLNSQWSISASNNAGGTAPEAAFTYKNVVTTTRLISPPVDMTGQTSVTLMFNHRYAFYDNPAPAYGVATRSAGGAWTSIWEHTPTASVGPETVILTISNSDMGHSDFQFCFYLNGNMYNLDNYWLDDIMLFQPLSLDASLKSISLPPYVVAGASNTLSGSIMNYGSTNINSFDIAYRIDGGAAQVSSVTGLNLALGESYEFTHSVPIVLNTAGIYNQVEVNIQNVNGGNDLNQNNDTLKANVGVLEYAPVRKVFCEEATGTWCGYCVRGICFMDYMAETYPETWIGVAVHNGDPMVNTAWDNEIPNIIPSFPGYPSGTIDRAGSNYWDPSQFEEGYQKRIAQPTPVTVEINNCAWDPATRDISFDLQSEFLLGTDDEMRFAAVIMEDSIHGTDDDYAQANYYAGGSLGAMCGFENLTNPIPAADMYYNHVGREILDSPYGTAGSIPAPITSGSSFTYHYTYNIPADWSFEHLHFAGLVINNTTGEIMNANNVVNWLGTNEPTRVTSLNVYPNPASNNAKVVFDLSNGQQTGLRILDITGRQVASFTQRTYPAGTNTINLDCSDLANGLYIVELTVGNTVFTKKLSVQK